MNTLLIGRKTLREQDVHRLDNMPLALVRFVSPGTWAAGMCSVALDLAPFAFYVYVV